jgi:tRNA(Ile)-lysidine synthase
MLDKFNSYVQTHRIFHETDKMVLAISGGLDSVCLLHILLETGIKPALAHCNFQLRGADSMADELLVRDLAGKYQLDLFIKSFETAEYAQNNKCSIQMAARELRYDWFAQLQAEGNFQKILLAHHRDDQVETFFINLLRGSGISGLKAMRPTNGFLGRPLLFAGRAQILAFALERKLTWREDKSNNEHKYLRNHIRHTLLPALNQIDEQYLDKVAASSAMLGEEETLFRFLLEQQLEKLVTTTDNGKLIDKKMLQKLPDFQVLLYRLLKDYGFNAAQVDEIKLCIDKPSGKHFLGNDYELFVGREYLELIKKEEGLNELSEWQIGEKANRLDFPVKLKFQSVLVDETFVLEKSRKLALLDFDRLKFPLKIRKWRQGDRFFPLGMTGTKLLSDFFTDEKFTESQKRNTFLLLDAENQIIWLIGSRLDNRFKISKNTHHVYRIEML